MQGRAVQILSGQGTTCPAVSGCMQAAPTMVCDGHSFPTMPASAPASCTWHPLTTPWHGPALPHRVLESSKSPDHRLPWPLYTILCHPIPMSGGKKQKLGEGGGGSNPNSSSCCNWGSSIRPTSPGAIALPFGYMPSRSHWLDSPGTENLISQATFVPGFGAAGCGSSTRHDSLYLTFRLTTTSWRWNETKFSNWPQPSLWICTYLFCERCHLESLHRLKFKI